MIISGFGMPNGLYIGYDKYTRIDERKSAVSTEGIASEEDAKAETKQNKALSSDEAVVTQSVQNESGNHLKISSEAMDSKPNRKRETKDIQDFIFDFKKNNDFNLVGARNKVEDVDIEKALSDMKKDDVLEQYKFFVKGSLVNDGDGSVRQVIRKDYRE